MVILIIPTGEADMYTVYISNMSFIALVPLFVGKQM